MALDATAIKEHQSVFYEAVSLAFWLRRRKLCQRNTHYRCPLTNTRADNEVSK